MPTLLYASCSSIDDVHAAAAAAHPSYRLQQFHVGKMSAAS